MPTFSCSIIIRAARAFLFDLTQDYTRRLSWDVFLMEARLLGDDPQLATGVRAWCVAWHGLAMETEYVTFSSPRLAAVRMTRGPALLASFAGAWRFDDAGPDLTRVTFRYHVTTRPRWLRPVLDPLLAAVFRRDTERRLRALKRVAENAAGEGRSVVAHPPWTAWDPLR